MGVDALSRTVTSPGLNGLACVLVVGAILAASHAEAQAGANLQDRQSQSLRDRVFGRNLPPTGRYVSEQGVGFVLDRTAGSRPLLRFDNSAETWALQPSPAPRGDVIYRTDAGDEVLRITPDGGMTLYTTRQPQGTPVSPAGSAEPLRPTPISPVDLARALIRQSGLAGRALGRTVVIDAPDVVPGSEAQVAETAAVAVEAIARVARAENLRGRASRIRRILILIGDRADVSMQGQTLRIVIQPARGPVGRPSSARIVRAVAAA